MYKIIYFCYLCGVIDKNDCVMTRNLEKLVTFASPTMMRLNMETIILSYEPGSDFAKALDELIRNSEGVRVVRRKSEI